MKRTEKDQKTGETPTPAHDAAGAGGSGKPVSWRKYIEETEAAEKRAEREAARERAAQIKKEKHGASALKETASAVLRRAGESRPKGAPALG